MKKIADMFALVFIGLVALMSLVAIMGIWEMLGGDVIIKAFATMGLLAGVALIVLIAEKFVDGNAHVSPEHITESGYAPSIVSPVTSNPRFTSIRSVTVAMLIVSVVLLALLGVMAIWEVLRGDALEKSLASIAVLAFGSFIITMVCLNREHSPLLRNRAVSGGSVVVVIIVMYFMFALLSMIM